MKNLIVVAMMMFASKAMADCQSQIGMNEATETKVITTDVPSHLKGATIVIRLADGRESSVPAEMFKVVPRKRQEIVTQKTQTVQTTCTDDSKLPKNRLSALVGRGTQEGLDVSKTATTVSAQSKVGAVGGVQYQRRVVGNISGAAQWQTNNTWLLGAGLDF